MGPLKKTGNIITLANQKINDLASWLIYPLVFVVMYEVLMRHILNNPTNWVYDMTWILYAIFVFLGGAYALHTGTHVKADIIYNMLPKKGQMIFDIISYCVFFFPVMIMLVYSTFIYFLKSLEMGDVSSATTWGPVLWPIKFVLFISMAMLLLQGIVEFCERIAPLFKRGGSEK